METQLLPLRNKKKEIVAHAIVSEEDYEHLSKFKWYKSGGYVKSTIKGKLWMLHRFIMITILGNDLTSKKHIDHINGNPLDNTRDNLRVVTNSENMRNKKKRENTSSRYIGISFHKNRNKWNSRLMINNKVLYAQYNNEIHAAHQVNLWIDEYNLKTATKNNIEPPKDFVLYIKLVKKDIDLPKGITKQGNNFLVNITIENKEKRIGTFKSLEEAVLGRKKAEKEKQEYLENKLLAIPKLYNKNGQCIFKVKDEEIIIDEEMYYDIIQYSWGKLRNYFHTRINGIPIGLTKFITKYIGDDMIDHINNNTLDNRRENLRIVTAKQNSMNKSSHKNSSSKYIGVEKSGRKWRASICVNGKRIELDSFYNEVEAAKARDQGTKKYFGEYGNLNFP